MTYKSKAHERTLILIKPDGLQRGLVGEIFTRFERKGLKFVGMKMVWPNEKEATAHYFWNDEEKTKTGDRTIAIYQEKGLPVTKTAIEYAEDVQRRLVRFLVTGPVIAFVLEGAHAIAHVRKLVGHGSPLQADVGTIRADYSIDSYVLADEFDRVSRNLVHASSSVEEAERELKVWFDESELFDYDLAIEKVLYDMDWEGPKQKTAKKK